MLDLNALTTAQQVAALYIGYYDRAADPEGSTFWNDVISNTQLDLGGVADDFATQAETLAAYPFLGNPTEEEANAFITEVYLNLFNREPDGPDSLTQEQIDAGEVDGLTFWSGVLQGAIAGTNDFSVGQIILSIIGGAQGDDQVTILNKIEVGLEWTAAAEVAGGEFDDAARESASSIIGPVTDEQATVDAAKAEIAEFFAPGPVEGNTLFLTSSTDVTGQPNPMTGVVLEASDDDDTFLGYLAQNGFTGGVSNSLSSADRLDGMGGTDRLYAELSQEFVGATSNGVTTDVQPKLTSIEIVELEARDMGNNGVTVNQSVDIDISGDNQIGGNLDQENGSGTNEASASFNEFSTFDAIFEDGAFDIDLSASVSEAVFTPVASFDGKDSFGITHIGSVNSDGDLLIENLNTKVNRDDAVGRKTADMTIVMDHTDNFNSDGDASDLVVYFDENYLLANDPVQSGALLTIELMDLDARTLGEDPLLDNPFGAITFTFGDEVKELNFGTDSNTYAELLADIQAAIDLAAQTDSDFSQLSASFGPIFTVRDTDEDPNPARPPLDGTTIVITNSGPEVLEAVNMIATGTQPAGKDFHTGFDNEAPEEENFKVEVDIDLHKVGRGGEGGNLIVGGKDQGSEGEGIHVFNVDVLGAGEDDPNGAPSKPSNLGTLTSTNGALETVNIETHADFVDGDTWASLTIREGFGDNIDLKMVNANDFLGDLTLGNVESVVDLDTLTALGGGDVTFFGVLTGNETDQDYVYMTGAGEDSVNVAIFGDSLDYANSGLEIKTGDGADDIRVEFAMVNANDSTNEQLNQAVLDNVDIDGEGGDDFINVDGIGNANINGGDGDDIIFTDGDAAGFEGVPAGQNAAWAFNFDNARADDVASTDPLDGPNTIGRFLPTDLPGVQTSWAYLDGAEVTVTLSGAGIANAAAGGGVMALPTEGAVQGDDGYEASFTITDLIGGNDYYGDQRDVNAAIIAAIEGDAVLDALLSVTIAANNTLVITSKTSGDFAAEDIRIDIEHGQATDSAYANAVLDEARELFRDSDLTLTDLWGTTTFTSAASYQTDDGDAPGVLFSDSVTTNAWYDGLSVRGTDIESNSANDNLHTRGSASASETDNVINGGNDDDIIVLSTDATPTTVLNYTAGGNNAMINGASNETVVMEGDFGDDTVMNFTTTSEVTPVGTPTPATATVGSITENVDGNDGTGAFETFTLDVNAVPESSTQYSVTFAGVTVVIPPNSSPTQIADLIAAAFPTDGTGAGTPAFESVSTAPGTVTFTAVVAGDIVPDVSVAGSFESTPSFEANAVIVPETYEDGAVAAASNESATFTFEDVPMDNVTAGESITITIETSDNGATATNVYSIDVNAADGDSDGVITGAELATAAAAAINAQPGFNAVATDNTVALTVDTALTGNPFVSDDLDITIDADIAGTNDNSTNLIGGIDFLDFTSYLTSMEDLSTNGTGAPDSDDSNTFIDVTLDDDLDDVQANEVAVVQFVAEDGETFGGLSASVLQALFNSTDAANNYGNLTVGANADDEYTETSTTDQLVGGAAKAIVMVENAANLGDYKVFELSWNGDASNDDDSTLDGTVSVSQIGMLDFGTSLTTDDGVLNDLTEVNLVGSEDYADLVANGILSFTI